MLTLTHTPLHATSARPHVAPGPVPALAPAPTGGVPPPPPCPSSVREPQPPVTPASSATNAAQNPTRRPSVIQTAYASSRDRGVWVQDLLNAIRRNDS